MAKDKIENINTHVHLFNEMFYPDRVFVGKLGVSHYLAASIIEILEASRTGANITEDIIEFFGKDSEIHLVKALDLFTSSFSECVDSLISDMNECENDISFPLLIDLTAVENEGDLPGYEWQVEEFSKLHKKTGGKLKPFYGFDPRRKNCVNDAIGMIEQGKFFGIKMYPPMGFSPDFNSRLNNGFVNFNLRRLYYFCEKFGIPITTHSSKNGIRGRKVSLKNARLFSHPLKWISPLIEFPKLIINFAHFGGFAEFIKHYHKKKESRTTDIRKMMLEWENVYAESAYFEGLTHGNMKIAQQCMRAAMGDYVVTDRFMYGDDGGISVFNFTPLENLEGTKKALVCEDDLVRHRSITPSEFSGQISF